MTVLFWSLWFRSGSTRVQFNRPICGRSSQNSTSSAAATVSTATAERGEHALTEALVHEAVDDGVDAGGRVGQEVDKGDGRAGQSVRRAPVERLPRVDDEHRHPAHEEQEDDDQQHPDDALLGHQVSGGATAAARHPAHRRRLHGTAEDAGAHG